MSRFLIGLVFLFLANAQAPARAEEPAQAAEAAPLEILPIVQAADAAQFVQQECVVELVVKSHRLLEGRQMCFLNSEPHRHDEGNLAVVLPAATLKKFAEQNINDPGAHFAGKRLRVKGKITLYEQRPQLMVHDLEQITVVDE